MSTAVGQYGFPAAGGGAVRRSESTKARILAAARKHFAASGYERATIRAIARKAGIDPALVMRYFGTKEKLFAAAAGPRGGRDQGRPGRHADAGNGAVPLRAAAAAGGGPRSRRGDPLARPYDSAIPHQ